TAFFVQSLSSSNAQTQTRSRYLPEYTASGDLVLPKNFHEWVFVGSPLTPNETLEHIVKHMATKEDFLRLDGRLDSVEARLASIESELRSIRRELDELRRKVENIEGYQKEIDYALERIAAIEKHLGLDKKVAV